MSDYEYDDMHEKISIDRFVEIYADEARKHGRLSNYIITRIFCELAGMYLYGVELKLCHGYDDKNKVVYWHYYVYIPDTKRELDIELLVYGSANRRVPYGLIPPNYANQAINRKTELARFNQGTVELLMYLNHCDNFPALNTSKVNIHKLMMNFRHTVEKITWGGK